MVVAHLSEAAINIVGFDAAISRGVKVTLSADLLSPQHHTLSVNTE